MKIQMNYHEYEIVELSQEEIRQHMEEHKYEGEPAETGKYLGQTYIDECKIYIDKDLVPTQKIQTLIHELMHVYIHTFSSSQIESYTEEQVCDLVSNSFFIIKEFVWKYFNIEDTKRNKDLFENFIKNDKKDID